MRRYQPRSTRRRPAREDEPAQRRQRSFEPIDRQLEALDAIAADHDFFDARGNARGRIREAGADGKQVLLQPLDGRADFFIDAGGTGGAQTGVQFVDLAVGIHPCVGFRHAGVVEERRLARIPGLRVDLQRVKL